MSKYSQNVISIGITLVGTHLNWLNRVHFLFIEESLPYSDSLHDLSVAISRRYKDVYVKSFFPHPATLWNSLPIECFPLTYDLNGLELTETYSFLVLSK